MCMHQSLYLSLHLQTRFGSRSDPNGIQNRMFRQFKNVCIRKALHVILWNVLLCRTKADAHDKFGFWVLQQDWLTDPNIALTKPKQKTRVQTPCSLSLSLSLLLRPAIKVWFQKIVRRAWSRANMHTKSYNLIRLCVQWSPHAERNFSDKHRNSFRCMPWADPEGGGGGGGGGRGSGPPWKITKI